MAARLTASFDELGDWVAAYGFQSWGRNAVNFLRIKGFEDRYDHAAQRRLGSLEPGGFTRLGAAIRHGTHLLTTKAGTSNTLLVVVGDGLPYDDGYEHRYAQEDRRGAARGGHRGSRRRLRQRPLRDGARGDRARLGQRPARALEEPSEMARHVTPLFRTSLRRRRPAAAGLGTTSNGAVRS